MKTRLPIVLAAAALLAGCVQTPRGSAADRDQNVLTGGPVTGTRLEDLPLPVLGVLRRTAPSTEIAWIETTNRGGLDIYRISFRNPEKTPAVFVSATGEVLSRPEKLP